MNEAEIEIFLQGVRLGLEQGKKVEKREIKKETVPTKKNSPRKYHKKLPWTEEEDKLVMSDMPMREILQRMPKRTAISVYGRRQKLKGKGNVALLNQ